MALLIIGLLLWSVSHLFRRIAPTYRAELGQKGRGYVAIASLLGLVAMVIGYRSWQSPQIWNPPAFATHINNLAMLVSVYLFAAAGLKTKAARIIRHPQLTAVKIWALAHLIVNGDLASIILFGGLLIWAVLEVIVINRSELDWTPPVPAPASKEIRAAVGTVVVYAAIAYIHILMGLVPFG